MATSAAQPWPSSCTRFLMWEPIWRHRKGVREGGRWDRSCKSCLHPSPYVHLLHACSLASPLHPLPPQGGSWSSPHEKNLQCSAKHLQGKKGLPLPLSPTPQGRDVSQSVGPLSPLEMTPPPHLLILGSEGSWLGLERQLTIVTGQLVGQRAQLIWAGGGLGDLQRKRGGEVAAREDTGRARRDCKGVFTQGGVCVCPRSQSGEALQRSMAQILAAEGHICF